MSPERRRQLLKVAFTEYTYQEFLSEVVQRLVRHSGNYSKEHPFYCSRLAGDAAPTEGYSEEAEKLNNMCGIAVRNHYRSCALGKTCLRAHNNKPAKTKHFCTNRKCQKQARVSSGWLYLCTIPPERHNNYNQNARNCFNYFHAGVIHLPRKRRRSALDTESPPTPETDPGLHDWRLNIHIQH